MNEKELFVQSDEALRSVIDRVTPDQLTFAVPADWSHKENPTLRDIVAYHVYDEAWVPDVLAGRTPEDVGDRFDGDLLGDDPIASYDRVHDAAIAAVNVHSDMDAVTHLSYGDFPASEFLVHTALYRAFQAWSIAKHLGFAFSLSDSLVEGLWDHVGEQIDAFRAIGVFPPEVAAPEGANREIQLLARTGYYVP